MALTYSEEHQIFRQSVRKFCEREILPHVDRWEREYSYPDEIYEKLGEQGFLGILVDEKWGGVGGDYLLAGAWCEEFGRVPSVGLTTGVNMHSVVVCAALNRLGNDEIKNRWLKPAVAGKAIGAYAFTEPAVGSDLSNLETRAVRDGDDYIINGAKTFITNGERADFIICLTRTEPSRGYDGFTTFVVDTSLPGFQVTRTLHKIGWHASDTAELSLVDVRVPQSMILGQLNRGWHNAMTSLEWERLMLVLNAIGGARQCLEETIPYINDRKVFKAPIAAFDHTLDLVSQMQFKLTAATSLAHRCLRLLQQGKRCRKEVSLAKLYACELAIEVADRCLQLHGGYGYTTEFRPERWLRDLRLNTIGGGTSEIMAAVVGKELGFL